MQLNIFKKISNLFCAPEHKNNSPQKLLIIPLNHQFSVQQVFASWNWDSFKVWHFLIFEVVKTLQVQLEPLLGKKLNEHGLGFRLQIRQNIPYTWSWNSNVKFPVFSKGLSYKIITTTTRKSFLGPLL